MNYTINIDLREPEKLMARDLLNKIQEWQETYERKARLKNPQISEEELGEKMLNAGANKFRKESNQILKMKLARLIAKKIN
ncbi:MAG: hypothetical protein PHG05_04410 [Candidatus Nanoarchaeia archaeon]|nr:hypothetical protein [Candidatus Nanoarchaeia archaeon]